MLAVTHHALERFFLAVAYRAVTSSARIPTPHSSVSNTSTWTPAVWVQLGIGILTVAVAFFVMRNGFRNTTKVDQAARRSEWWKRTQWAIDLALGTAPRNQEVGVLALDQLLNSELAEQDDRAVANAVMSALLPHTDGETKVVLTPDDQNPGNQGGSG